VGEVGEEEEEGKVKEEEEMVECWLHVANSARQARRREACLDRRQRQGDCVAQQWEVRAGVGGGVGVGGGGSGGRNEGI
jgi:hypothetical protein